MTRINYKLDDFEGPLDLLLTLISKNKMSIAQVEIITIINQYLDVIRQAQAVDLDIASDFIDMAARLIYLKSVYLLPKDEEGEKLKAELQGQLIEYSRAKQAAALMREMYTGDKMYFKAGNGSGGGLHIQFNPQYFHFDKCLFQAVGKGFEKVPAYGRKFSAYRKCPYGFGKFTNFQCSQRTYGKEHNRLGGRL